MAKVGTAYVEIKPDLTGFARELKTKLAAARQPTIAVRPDLDRFGAQVRAGVRRSGPELDRMGRWMADKVGRAFSLGWTASGTKRFFQALSRMSDGVVGVLTTPIGIAAAALGVLFAAGFVASLTAALSGLAVIGFGVFLVAQEQVVKDAAKRLAQTATKAFKEAAKPFVKPVVAALGIIEAATVRWAKVMAPVFAELAKFVVPLTNALVSMTNQILSGFLQALPAMKSTLTALGPVLEKIGTAIGDFFRMLGRHPQELAELMTILGDRIVGVIHAITAVTEFAIVVTRRWHEQIDRLTNSVKDWLATSPQVARFRQEAKGVGQTLREAFRPENMPTGVRDLLTQTREGFVTATADIRKAVTDLWTTVSPILAKWWGIFQTQFIPMFRRLWTEAQPVLTQLGATFKSVFEFVAAVVRNAVTTIQFWFTWIDKIASGIWDRFGRQIMSSIEGALKGVLEILQGAFQVVQGIFQVLTGILTGDWSKAWTGIKNIFFGAIKIITGGFQATVNVLKGLWFAFLGAIQTQWSGAWNRIVGALSGAWSGIVGWFRRLPGDILRAVGNVGSLLWGIGQSIVDGLINGIRSAWWRVTDAVRSLTNRIPSGVRSLLGIGSPSRVMAGLGREVPRGFAQGIRRDTPRVGTALDAMVGLPRVPAAPIGQLQPQRGLSPSLLAVLSIDGKFFDLRVEKLIEAASDASARDLLAGRRAA